MKQIFIRFEAKKTGSIRLFRIAANQRILHANTNKNGIEYPGYRYFFLSKYFISFFSKRIFEANICQYEKKLKRIFDSYRIMYLFCIKSNICEFVRIFSSEYKQIMPINGVCEYTETCEYEANKIHIRLIRFKANKKVTDQPVARLALINISYKV
jgi:hypothetical protein